MIKKKIVWIVPVMLLVQSCFPSFESTSENKLFVKEIENKSVKLEWFFYSGLTFQTPDYVTIKKGSQIDTICIANNIANLELQGGKVIVGFYGGPKKYMKPVLLPQTVLGYQIIADTTHVNAGPAELRKFYKKQ